jgi:hypothetical protein
MSSSISEEEIKEHNNALIVIPAHTESKTDGGGSVFDDDIDIEVTINKKKTQSLPKTFESTKEWLKRTPVLCWYCSSSIKKVPVPLPISKSMGKYGIEKKLFCTFNCVMAEVRDKNYPKSEANIIKTLLEEIYEIFHKKKINFIAPSPGKGELVRFGGDLDEDKYHEKIAALQNSAAT